MTEQTHYVAFERAQAQMLLRDLNELREVAEFLTRDMAKISRGEIRDPMQFAKESVIGAAMFTGPR